MPSAKNIRSIAATVYPNAPEMQDLLGAKIRPGSTVIFSATYGKVSRLSMGSVLRVGLNVYKKSPNRMGVEVRGESGSLYYRDCKDVCVLSEADT